MNVGPRIGVATVAAMTIPIESETFGQVWCIDNIMSHVSCRAPGVGWCDTGQCWQCVGTLSTAMMTPWVGVCSQGPLRLALSPSADHQLTAVHSPAIWVRVRGLTRIIHKQIKCHAFIQSRAIGNKILLSIESQKIRRSALMLRPQ